MTKDEKKERIGMGIRALLNTVDTQTIEQRRDSIKEASRTVNEIPIDWIEVNPFQPRKDFDDQALQEMAASIRTHGIIQPLTVRRVGEERFQLIAGERRLRAARLAGLETVPAYILLTDDQGMIEIALIENIQREDLNALDVAISLNRLFTECHLTHESLSTRVGKDRSTVTNYMRLLKLPPEIQQALRNNIISMGHARALAGIPDLMTQMVVFRQVVNKHLSVRALEALIKDYGSGNTRSIPASTQDAEIRKIQDTLAAILGAKVAIKRNAKGAGQITIHFSSDKALNAIVETLEEMENG
jgi:ParB family transcriptional regulator, chromosome partitioning protein